MQDLWSGWLTHIGLHVVLGSVARRPWFPVNILMDPKVLAEVRIQEFCSFSSPRFPLSHVRVIGLTLQRISTSGSFWSPFGAHICSELPLHLLVQTNSLHVLAGPSSALLHVQAPTDSKKNLGSCRSGTSGCSLPQIHSWMISALDLQPRFSFCFTGSVSWSDLFSSLSLLSIQQSNQSEM